MEFAVYPFPEIEEEGVGAGDDRTGFPGRFVDLWCEVEDSVGSGGFKAMFDELFFIFGE